MESEMFQADPERNVISIKGSSFHDGVKNDPA